MKSTSPIGVLTVIMLIGGGCSEPAPRPASTAVVPAGYQTHNAQYYHFSISYPEDWEVETNNQNGTAVQVFSPAENETDNFAENLNVIETNLRSKISLEDFVEGGRNKNRTTEGYKEISYTDLIIDGYPAKRLEYSATPALESGETMNTRLVQYATLTPEKFFTITCTLTEERANEYMDECDKMVGSFKISETAL